MPMFTGLAAPASIGPRHRPRPPEAMRALTAGCKRSPDRFQCGPVRDGRIEAHPVMHDFTLLVTEDAYGASVAVSLDILRAAASLAPGAGTPVPRWRVCSLEGGTVALQSGIRMKEHVEAARGLEGRPDRAGSSPASASTAKTRFAPRSRATTSRRLAVAVERHVARGGRVATGCSAAFMLRARGPARRAARHHHLVAGGPLLQRMNPGLRRRRRPDGVRRRPHRDRRRGVRANRPDAAPPARGGAGSRVVETLLERFLLGRCAAGCRDRATWCRRCWPAATSWSRRIVARVETALPDIPSVRRGARRSLLRLASGRSPDASGWCHRPEHAGAGAEHSPAQGARPAGAEPHVGRARRVGRRLRRPDSPSPADAQGLGDEPAAVPPGLTAPRRRGARPATALTENA